MRLSENDEIFHILQLLTILMLITGLIVVLSGCAEAVREYPIDSRYTASYAETKTRHKIIYDINGESHTVSDTYTVAHPETYEILYEIEYDDGRTRREWRQVTKAEYYDFEKEQGR